MINEIARRFGQCADTYDTAASVQQRVAERLAHLATPHLPQGANILEIGCGTGVLSQSVARSASPVSLTLNDISPEMVGKAESRVLSSIDGSRCSIAPLVADAEQIDWPKSDAVVSSSAVQWFKNPLSFVFKAKAALSDGGVVAVATYGPMTFNELRSDAPNAYPSLAQWVDEFRNQGFIILHQEEAFELQSFNSRMSLLRMVALSGIGGRGGNQSTASLCSKWQLTWQIVYVCARL